jgi:glycerophosphoryl diester phosphodiesterase
MNPQWPYPFWIAHRGAGRQAPENTLAALRLGLGLGWRGFEVDAKISADGVPFLLHDRTLERTTTEHGRASDRMWAELQTLDAAAWHHSEHAFEPIPSLAQALDLVWANGASLNIEIKPTPGDETATGRAVAELALARWLTAQDQARSSGQPAPIAPLLSSFQTDSLQAARHAAPALPRAHLFHQVPAHGLELALDLSCCACVVHHERLDAAVVQGLAARGLKVWVYTVNEVESAQRLAAWGVDGLITDAVQVFDPGLNPQDDPQRRVHLKPPPAARLA